MNIYRIGYHNVVACRNFQWTDLARKFIFTFSFLTPLHSVPYNRPGTQHSKLCCPTPISRWKREATARSSSDSYAFCRVRPWDVEPELHRELFDAVLSDPPYKMRWMSAINDELRSQIMTLVLDEGVSAELVLEKGVLSEESYWYQLVAFRGLLAHGMLLHCMLLHCLQMRPRVTYGVSRALGAKKRLAIPFRACNTPADRSEFKEPMLERSR